MTEKSCFILKILGVTLDSNLNTGPFRNATPVSCFYDIGLRSLVTALVCQLCCVFVQLL